MKPFKDPKHWLGWLISLGGIWLTLNLLGVLIKTYEAFIVLLVIVIIDSIKHEVGLQ